MISTYLLLLFLSIFRLLQQSQRPRRRPGASHCTMGNHQIFRNCLFSDKPIKHGKRRGGEKKGRLVHNGALLCLMRHAMAS